MFDAPDGDLKVIASSGEASIGVRGPDSRGRFWLLMCVAGQSRTFSLGCVQEDHLAELAAAVKGGTADRRTWRRFWAEVDRLPGPTLASRKLKEEAVRILGHEPAGG